MNPNLDNSQGLSTSDIVHSEFHERYLEKKKKSWKPCILRPIFCPLGTYPEHPHWFHCPFPKFLLH